jgi:hypothetical protein
VDKDGITGFTSRSLLTAPVFGADGRVVAVVQLVNKNPRSDLIEDETLGRRRSDGSAFVKSPLKNGGSVPNPSGKDAADSRASVPSASSTDDFGDDASRWDEGWIPSKVTHKIEKEIKKAKRTRWWRRVFGKRRVGFDESDEKLIWLICHHVSVSLAAMEHTLPLGE